MIFGVLEGGLADSQREIMSHLAKATNHEKVFLVNLAIGRYTHDS